MTKRKTYKTAIQQGYIDEETGEQVRQTVTTEIIEGFIDVKLPKRNKLNNGNFIVVFQKAMFEIAKHNKNFTRNEMILLFYFLGTAGIANSIYIDYPTLVEELGIKRPNMVTAVNSLVRKGIIIKEKPFGSRSRNEAQVMEVSLNFDQLNYNLAYNGKFKDFKKVLPAHPEIMLEPDTRHKQITIFDAIKEAEKESDSKNNL